MKLGLDHSATKYWYEQLQAVSVLTMSLNFNISTDLLYSMYILHAYLAAQYLYSFED